MTTAKKIKELKLVPSVKAKWLAALRSGKYKQTQYELRNKDKPNAFCCLGVLCNIHAEEHPEFAAKQKKIGTYDGSEGYPSQRVLKWAFGPTYNKGVDGRVDVKHPDPNVTEEVYDETREQYIQVPYSTTLAVLNDDDALSFKQIARVIEKQL